MSMLVLSFNVYIFVDLVKYGVLTLVDEILHYGNDCCYYYIFCIIICISPNKEDNFFFKKFWLCSAIGTVFSKHIFVCFHFYLFFLNAE